MKIKSSIFTLFIVIQSFNAFSQNVKSDKVYKELNKIMNNVNYPKKDSLLVYALNFQLTIEKKNGKSILTHITANDSLAYSIFPSYKKLANIDFSEYLGAKKSICIVIPILMYGNPQQPNPSYQNGTPLKISLNAALNTTLALYDLNQYDNIKEAEMDFAYRSYHVGPKPNTKTWDNKDIIYLGLFMFKMYTVK